MHLVGIEANSYNTQGGQGDGDEHRDLTGYGRNVTLSAVGMRVNLRNIFNECIDNSGHVCPYKGDYRLVNYTRMTVGIKLEITQGKEVEVEDQVEEVEG